MSYTAKDIETLDFKTAIRTRVAMYMGSDDNNGVFQCIKEIISNSIDEYSMGYGNKILVELFPNNRIRITDWARGCPFGVRDDGTEAMEAIFMSAHSGGKFSDKTYQMVIGMNGIGGKGVALSSLDFIASSRRDGQEATLAIHKGDKVNFITTSYKGKDTGTTVEFTPDAEVYSLEPIHIDFERVKTLCKDWAYLNSGLHFDLVDHTGAKPVKVSYYSENGVLDLMREEIKKPLHPTPLYGVLEENGVKMEACCQWTSGVEQSYVFTNGLHNTAGGTSLTGAKTAITRTINSCIAADLSGDLARTGLVYVVNAKIPNASFTDQTKTKVNNPVLRTMADKLFSSMIKEFFKSNKREAKLIEDFLVKEFRAERAAEKARAAVLEQNGEIERESKKKVVLAGKLTDCRYHDERSELFLVEGKSAGTAIANARDGDKIAVFPCRGKGLNVLKETDIERILRNTEYQEIMIALGCGYAERFNLKKLRYGKIVIATDADVDGHAIACLLLTFFYRFYPQLIREGRIYRAIFPLYQVTAGKKVYYAYNDEELSKLPKGDVFRMKGIGEVPAEVFSDTIFSAEGRYTQFTMEDAAEAEVLFNTLLGTNLNARREYIHENVDWESEF